MERGEKADTDNLCCNMLLYYSCLILYYITVEQAGYKSNTDYKACFNYCEL